MQLIRLNVRQWIRAPIVIALAFLPARPIHAEATLEEPTSVGTLLSADASVFARAAPDKEWKIVRAKESVRPGDLLVGLPEAAVSGANGGVKLKFHSDLSNTSPFPILESAVRIHRNAKLDLDLTLDRGRVELVNTKAKGEATVQFRFYTDEVWKLTLNSPGTRVVLEYFGRWPRGSRFLVTPPKGRKHEPILYLTILVLEGSIQRECPSCELFMKAPPGPAIHSWDNVTGKDMNVKRLAKVPAWVRESTDSDSAKQWKRTLDEFRKSVLKDGLDKTIRERIQSEKKSERTAAIIAAGALDKLNLVGDALLTGRNPDTWNDAVVVVRHWIGRAPGHDRIFYRKLVENRNVKPAHAETIVQLMHGFTDLELARPETYAVLIDYLEHPVVGIRGLANWHLQHAVPDAKIPYNPTDAKEELRKARDAWKKVIPDGKLPPKPSGEKD